MGTNLNIQAYDPDDIILVIGGIPILDGFGPDGITVARSNAHNEIEDGIRGDTSVNRSRVTRGMLTVNLFTSSIYDQALDELQGVDVNTFPVAIVIRSLNKAVATLGWYEEMPDLAVGTTQGSRTHTIGLKDARLGAISNALNLAGGLIPAL